MPDVLAAEGEAEGLQAHRLVGHVAGEDDQVGPAELVAVLLLDRPQQAARLVEVGVVRPGVDRREALVAGAGAAAAVGDAVGAGRVPGHADHQAAVVAPVGRPPVLAVGHQRLEVFLQRRDVELLEFFAIVEVRRPAGWSCVSCWCRMSRFSALGHQSMFDMTPRLRRRA
jgi:hypothetical protein